MKHKVYIDGQAGTTGLQLRQKLQNHKDVEILLISEELRKDEAERKRLMNEAEVVFLCLPDDAAKEAVKLVENPNTCIIDASTAHRTDPRLPCHRLYCGGLSPHPAWHHRDGLSPDSAQSDRLQRRRQGNDCRIRSGEPLSPVRQPQTVRLGTAA